MPNITRRRDRVAEEPVDTEEDVVEADDEEEERPRRTREERTTRSRDNDDDERPARKASGPPEGVRTGWTGADETAKRGGGGGSGVNWLRVEKKRTELVRFLEDGPVSSFQQHWLDSPSGEGRSRTYLCPGAKCPLCARGSKLSSYYVFNVLHLSGGATPEVKALQINQTAYKNLKEVFEDRRSGLPVIDADGIYGSIKKTGEGFQTRTTFGKVKERDLEEEWDDVLEYFDLDDMPNMVKEAKDELYSLEEVSPKPTPRRELDKLAQYLDEEPEDDD